MSEERFDGVHKHSEKSGFLPRAAGEKVMKKVPQSAPAHGLHETDKTNEHAFKHAPYGKGIKLEGNQHD